MQATMTNKKTGVLLISLGTPNSTSVKDVRRFLAEFLSDGHVVALNKLIWLPILYGPILTFRPAKTAQAYKKIWNTQADESPLRTISREQAEQLAQKFEQDDIVIDWAFRYGNPSIDDKINAMKAAGCERVLLFALYPQNSDTTTGTAYEKSFESITAMRDQMEVRTVRSYHDNACYIKALKTSIDDSLTSIDWEPDVILASNHSIPKPYSDAGDAYLGHIEQTHALLKDAMGPLGEKLQLSFQSRFGFQEWLRPYTDDAIKELAASGAKKIAVVSPCFSADCLETLEEINIQYREMFIESGGTHFHYIPCLNASPAGIDVLEDVIREHLWR